jgi:hypothetical protein
MKRNIIVGGAGALGLLIAPFVSWIKVIGLISAGVSPGLDGDGWIFFTASLLTGLALLISMRSVRKAGWALVVVGLASSASATYELINVQSAISEMNNDSEAFAHASLGLGVPLAFVAALAVLASGLLVVLPARFLGRLTTTRVVSTPTEETS